MNNWDFVVWMIAFPAIGDLLDIAKYKWGEKKKYSENTEALTAFICLCIWFGVGALLY